MFRTFYSACPQKKLVQMVRTQRQVWRGLPQDSKDRCEWLNTLSSNSFLDKSRIEYLITFELLVCESRNQSLQSWQYNLKWWICSPASSLYAIPLLVTWTILLLQSIWRSNEQEALGIHYEPVQVRISLLSHNTPWFHILISSCSNLHLVLQHLEFWLS